MSLGGFCLVLHTHLPYVRRHGAWPCGEDWFHQAAVDAYLPLARTFRGLAVDGLTGLATVCVSPILATQMADRYMTGELHLYLGRLLLRAERQAANYRGPFEEETRDLAAFYHRRYGSLLDEFEKRWEGGIHLAFRELAHTGTVELTTSFAGHPFVPLLRDDGLALGQLHTGIAEHQRLFGTRPAGVWLPECGYRPPERDRPGVEALLEKAGIAHTVVDAPTFEAAGLSVRGRVGIEGSGISAFARDMEASYLIWSPAGGYPAGPWYRDFHHYDMEAGFRSFRVTDPRVPVAGKRPYEPPAARQAAIEDADRFARAVESRLEAHRLETNRPGLLLACFDTELFGHWWFEGPEFLDSLFRRLTSAGRIEVLTLSAALDRFPPERESRLPLSSWGRGKDTSAWLSPATEPIWGRIWDGERQVREALRSGIPARVARQAIRELLLLSASDWPFMVGRGRTADYARERVETHAAALATLLDDPAEAALARLEDRDNPFPALREEDFH